MAGTSSMHTPTRPAALLPLLLLLVLSCCSWSWEHGLHSLVVTSSRFTDCFVVHITAVNATLAAPTDLAASACRLSPWHRGGPGSAASNASGGCAWEVLLEEDSEEGCVEAVAGWVQNLLHWASTVDALPYVSLPVRLKKQNRAGQGEEEEEEEVLFVPRSRSSLGSDSSAFCQWNKIEGVSEQDCAAQLQAAAEQVYKSRRSYLPPAPPAVLCPRHAPLEGGLCQQQGPGCPLLVAFWHVAALDGGGQGGGVWQEIVEQQLAALQGSGLLGVLHWVSVHVAGPGRRQVEQMVEPYPSIHVDPTPHSRREYEYATLAALQDHCAAHPTSWVLYFHNKGASRTDPRQQRFVSAWRRYLEAFVLWRFRSCLAVLQAGYDTCGVQWADDWAIYGGNFWWARCEYVNSLPSVRSLPQWVRHLAESWVGLGQGFCPVSCHYAASRFLYGEELGPDDYQNVTTGCDVLWRSGGSRHASAYDRLHVKAQRAATSSGGSARPALVWGDGLSSDTGMRDGGGPGRSRDGMGVTNILD